VALKDKELHPGLEPDQRIAASIGPRLEEGQLSCPEACAVAVELGCPPLEVGRTADVLGIHLTRCQLGLFGHPGHAKGWEPAGVAARPVPAGLEAAILEVRDPGGRIGCRELWRLAARFGVERMQVGYVADRLGVKIHACQLGAF
jgi:hypothetical protein